MMSGVMRSLGYEIHKLNTYDLYTLKTPHT